MSASNAAIQASSSASSSSYAQLSGGCVIHRNVRMSMVSQHHIDAMGGPHLLTSPTAFLINKCTELKRLGVVLPHEVS